MATPQIRMQALKDFRGITGREFKADEVFEVSPAEAASYNYQRTATFVTKAIPPKAPEPEPEQPRRRRTYRRRDLVAEQP